MTTRAEPPGDSPSTKRRHQSTTLPMEPSEIPRQWLVDRIRGTSKRLIAKKKEPLGGGQEEEEVECENSPDVEYSWDESSRRDRPPCPMCWVPPPVGWYVSKQSVDRPFLACNSSRISYGCFAGARPFWKTMRLAEPGGKLDGFVTTRNEHGIGSCMWVL